MNNKITPFIQKNIFAVVSAIIELTRSSLIGFKKLH